MFLLLLQIFPHLLKHYCTIYHKILHYFLIKNTLPNNINLEIKNTICNTTQIRQKETEEIAKQVDLMIVIGGKNSSNTKKLYEISQKYCNRVYLVQTSKDLISEHFQDINKIGIIAGASTPQNIIDDIVSFCKK